MIMRLLNPQGLAGLIAGACLAALLLLQQGKTRHWHKQSVHFEQLYRAEQAAFAWTTAGYRAAAVAARAADQANAARVTAEQRSINERTAHDFQNRLAAARAAAERLRGQVPAASADPRSGGSSSVPGLPASAGSLDQASGEDRLPESDRLIATEQAIQLDELIKWVNSQAKLDVNDAGPKP